MRFIVDVYRYVILGGIALAIITVVYAALKVGTISTAYGSTVLIGGAALIVITVMSLGITATFISLHDRHAEAVDELRALRFALEARR
jgi:hypothetical protein